MISLIIGFLVKWQIAKYLVNALTSLFAFFVILLITNTIGAFVVNSLGVFDITGLIIGTIIGGIFGVISEALRFDD
ncbi:MAG: hypothetical protein OEX81_00725 [Candidatus Pacebacteria bacterium]|nr:hypothetical protein [Candidatus Paceibacterota bacterium]